MVFRKFRRNSESDPSHATNGQFDPAGSSADANLDPRERAKRAREQQARRGQAAIKAAQLGREELFGRAATRPRGENARPQPTAEERRLEEEQLRKAAEEAQRLRDEEDERLREAAREAERLREEARRRREEWERRRQEQEEAARQHQAESPLTEAEQLERAQNRMREIREEAARRHKEAAEDGISLRDQAVFARDHMTRFLKSEESHSFDGDDMVGVIETILSKRELGESDRNIYVDFLRQAQRNDPTEVLRAQISGHLTFKYRLGDRTIDTAKTKSETRYCF